MFTSTDIFLLPLQSVCVSSLLTSAPYDTTTNLGTGKIPIPFFERSFSLHTGASTRAPSGGNVGTDIGIDTDVTNVGPWL